MLATLTHTSGLLHVSLVPTLRELRGCSQNLKKTILMGLERYGIDIIIVITHITPKDFYGCTFIDRRGCLSNCNNYLMKCHTNVLCMNSLFTA